MELTDMTTPQVGMDVKLDALDAAGAELSGKLAEIAGVFTDPAFTDEIERFKAETESFDPEGYFGDNTLKDASALCDDDLVTLSLAPRPGEPRRAVFVRLGDLKAYILKGSGQ